MNGVHIKQYYPGQNKVGVQGDIGRFNIYVDGLRLTEPISNNFVAPFSGIRPFLHSGQAVRHGQNMKRAGWFRLLFEPYD